tara:strand:- start:1170 stop:1391 length:222 start_codon:yes stop_codon:yes gene_type:complete
MKGKIISLMRATPDNIKNYIGFQCIYNHRTFADGRPQRHIATITGTSGTGKTLYIDNAAWPSLTFPRAIYIIL